MYVYVKGWFNVMVFYLSNVEKRCIRLSLLSQYVSRLQWEKRGFPSKSIVKAKVFFLELLLFIERFKNTN